MKPSPQPEHESLSTQSSDVSDTATAVNSPVTPQFPPCTLQPSPNSSSHSLSSDDAADSQDEAAPAQNDDPLQGWPQLALLMSKTPDLAAFPRFRDLNVKSLLYYQCQLTILREKLQELEKSDAREGKDWAQYADDLVESGSAQFQTMEEIRKVLKKYNKAMLQYSKICALSDPDPFNMRTLRKWLRNEACANFAVRGRGGLENTWGDVYKNPDEEVGTIWTQFFRLISHLIWARSPSIGDLDLAVTAPQTKVDGLTRWVVTEFIPFRRALGRKWKEMMEKKKNTDEEATTPSPVSSVTPPTVPSGPAVKKEETIVSWSEKGALRVTSGISTVVACLLPVIAISVLSQLHGIRNLLFCLAGFAVIFALGLIFLTQGTSSRTEIFAATAAFSAVMVVFISVPPAPIIDISVPPGQPTPSVTAILSL
ncbi:hypothetical protein BCR34DRAFT_603173 [Clohesyomyces aquaticus]|uniref:DUF6594 domain-containing protein n=1 Tax=Clohesyomyces aquaticus TaxID=1231657 RepID=A0A1Y1ZGT5_9PLEO|nr:hypothetical protein BCR34DRAFT_603173 [Clohesyomyces aquaticus]